MAAKDEVFEGSWTHRSLQWIDGMRAENATLSARELERKCRNEYPFGERSGWVYRAWLKAMRMTFRGGGARPATRKDGSEPRCELTMDMFTAGNG